MAEEEEGGLDVSWMCQSSLCPQGHKRDKHQISLTKMAVPESRSWHRCGGMAWILAQKRPLLGIKGTA